MLVLGNGGGGVLGDRWGKDTGVDATDSDTREEVKASAF